MAISADCAIKAARRVLRERLAVCKVHFRSRAGNDASARYRICRLFLEESRT